MNVFLDKILGILLGIRRHGWTKVPMVVMETEGAKSFNEALHAGEVVKLDAIKSIATSLGSLCIQKELLVNAGSPYMTLVSNKFYSFNNVVMHFYYGEEIGMVGTGAHENIRRPMQWTNQKHAGFLTRIFLSTTCGHVILAHETADHVLLEHGRDQLTLRQKSK